MLERAAEAAGTADPPAGKVLPGRFARDDAHFAVTRPAKRRTAGDAPDAPLPGFEPAEVSR